MPRRLLPLAVIGTALAAPSSALAQSGTGGATPTPRLRATTFRVAPGSVVQGGAVKFAWRIDGPVRKATARVAPGSVVLGRAVRFAWRIDGPVRKATARVALLPADGGVAVWVRLGVRAIGTRATRTWTPALAPGRYVARLHARGRHGAKLRRTARAAGRVTLEITAPAVEPVPTPAAVTPGIFPVQGAYDFGGEDARFGAGRNGHVHQGQDIIAAEGTPVVTPVAGLVHWRAYQASGAGHYVVVRGDDGRDYVFMHMQDGAVVAEKGRRVAAGERLGSVGNTGDSSGAHLHFEIWPDGWYAGEGSQPIDPLPDLLAWAAAA